MHGLRWCLYLVRLALYFVWGLLRFISKPGSRVIVPLALIVIAFLARPALHDVVADLAHQLDPGYQPESFMLDAAIVIGVLVLIAAYTLVSKALSVTLGAFPVAMRPLPPQRKLKPTDTQIKPAVVRVVVPPLPKSR